MKTNLNELRDKIYSIAKSKGWHETELSDSHCFCLIVSELMEAVEADRKDKRADIRLFEESMTVGESFEGAFKRSIKNTVEDELADAVIRILDFAGLRNVDLTVEYDEIEDVRNEINETFPEMMYILSQAATAWRLKGIRFVLTTWVELIIGYCQYLNINIFYFIEKKIEYNRTREYKHGKRY